MNAAAVGGRLAMETPPKGESSLLVLLLEDTIPRWLATPALAAAADLVAPVVGVRGGSSSATIRFGGGQIRLENGIAGDAWTVIEGDIDTLLQMGVGDALARPILTGRIHVRPRLGMLGALRRPVDLVMRKG